MEHARAVDVQDGVEAVPVPVEEELCPSPDEEVMSFNSDTVETAVLSHLLGPAFFKIYLKFIQTTSNIQNLSIKHL